MNFWRLFSPTDLPQVFDLRELLSPDITAMIALRLLKWNNQLFTTVQLRFSIGLQHTLRSKWIAQMPQGRLVKGPYEPICRDYAIYFSITVPYKTSCADTYTQYFKACLSNWISSQKKHMLWNHLEKLSVLVKSIGLGLSTCFYHKNQPNVCNIYQFHWFWIDLRPGN